MIGPAAAAVSMDNTLKNLIDTIAPEYYDSTWSISESQFKAWIAIITLSEAPTGNWGYAAQSTGSLGHDVFNHIGLGATFKFSTGMGPFQLDNGGSGGGESWSTMTTLDKTDPEKSLRSVLRWHNVRFGSSWTGANAPTLSDFYDKSAWFGVKRWGTSGDLKTYWNLITDSNWDDVKDKRVDVAFHPPTINAPYGNYVKKVGNYYWNILNGCYDTWLIKGKGPGYSGEFYYAYDDTLEIWVYNEAEKKSGFIRKYVQTQLPQDSSGGTVTLGTANAGFTYDKKIVDPSGPCVDIVFLIDTTGSMWDDIDNVKSSSEDIVNTLDTAEYNYRVAVANYKDYPIYPYGNPTDYVYKLDLPFKNKDNKADIIGAINRLSASGGADWQESVYSALVNALSDNNKDIGLSGNYGWRKGATKAIILMGDAPPHDPEPWIGGHKFDDVTYWSSKIDPVKVYSIVVGRDRTTYNKFSSISEATGGKVYESPTASEVVDSIIEAIEDIGGPTPNRKVSVNITPTLNEISSGNSVTYSVNITNEGTINDTYNISIDPKNFVYSYRAYPVAIQPSWMTFNSMPLELDSGMSDIRPLAINVPSNWAGMEDVIYSFSITAKSETDETVSNTSSAELKVIANKRSMAEYSKLEIQWLSELVNSSSIDHGIKNALLAKLTNAGSKVDEAIANINDNTIANNMLQTSQNVIKAFVNQVNAQYDKKIMQPDATMLIEKANQILQDIEKTKNA